MRGRTIYFQNRRYLIHCGNIGTPHSRNDKFGAANEELLVGENTDTMITDSAFTEAVGGAALGHENDTFISGTNFDAADENVILGENAEAITHLGRFGVIESGIGINQNVPALNTESRIVKHDRAIEIKQDADALNTYTQLGAVESGAAFGENSHGLESESVFDEAAEGMALGQNCEHLTTNVSILGEASEAAEISENAKGQAHISKLGDVNNGMAFSETVDGNVDGSAYSPSPYTIYATNPNLDSHDIYPYYYYRPKSGIKTFTVGESVDIRFSMQLRTAGGSLVARSYTRFVCEMDNGNEVLRGYRDYGSDIIGTLTNVGGVRTLTLNAWASGNYITIYYNKDFVADIDGYYTFIRFFEKTIPLACDFVTLKSDSQITLETDNEKKNWDGNITYSVDGYTGSWRIWDGETPITGNTIRLRGRNNTYVTDKDYDGRPFKITGTNVSVSGNLACLLDNQTVTSGGLPALSSGCFKYLFYDTPAITDLRGLILPWKTLADECFSEAFELCTSLVYGVCELQADVLPESCYYSLYSGCNALKNPSIVLASEYGSGSCQFMYSGRSFLEWLPVPRKTTKLGDMSCYYMLSGRSIKVSETLVGAYTNEFKIETDLEGTWALMNMFFETNGTFTGTPVVGRVYYTTSKILI